MKTTAYVIGLSEDMKYILDGTFDVAIGNANAYGKYKLAQQMQVVKESIDDQFRLARQKELTIQALAERFKP